ncbi:virginiamycin B lyase [bacterium BMS3Abin05]|nr:virginiamycin B lyase [bacterium BMS3Abin05]GBE27295.1 virginiamycin B lyase [bacterium BMS3Bbin03]HDL78996.1 hypothetical protein [Bacteroidota bacterium]HDZ13098.1 hypothetical protein [Bacteroidota bacterium]
MKIPGKRVSIPFIKIEFWTMAVLLAAFVQFQCAERQHSNPLDPLNPVTEGKPSGLRVVSDHHKVLLDWPAIGIHSITGYAIYRRADSSAVRKIAALPALKRAFTDTQTTYGTRYHYSYAVIAGNYESPLSDPVAITPGPSFFWVSYGSIGEILKLTFDIEHTYKTVDGLAYPSTMALDKMSRGIWAADEYLGQINRISGSGEIRQRIDGFGRITSIAVDTVAERIWIADSRNKRVVNLDETGNALFAVSGLENPARLAVDQKRGSCWIVDTAQKIVLQTNRSGGALHTIKSLLNPKWVSIPGKDGSVWVADSSRVVRISLEGKILSTVTGFKYAYRVAPDFKRNVVWVLDQSYGWVGTELIKADENGRRLVQLKGFGFPKNMVIDSFDGSCVVADTYNLRVVKVSSNGEISNEWKYGASPWWVAIEK